VQITILPQSKQKGKKTSVTQEVRGGTEKKGGFFYFSFPIWKNLPEICESHINRKM